MDLAIENDLKRHHVKIMYAPLQDGDGYIISYHQHLVLAIREGLPEQRENEVALHELGHLKLDLLVYGSYREDDRVHTLMESNANTFMLKYCLRSYMDENDFTPNEVNPIAFCEYYGLSTNLADNVRYLLGQKEALIM